MKNSNKLFIRLTVFSMMIFALTASVSGQIKLRNALDYDGDNKADFGVFRTIDSTWYLNKSGGTASSQQFGVSNFDTITPGDYDGDGKGDLAVWRYSDRVWYVLNSATGTVSSTQFGLNGDEPMQNDYDGDGKTDISVWRESDGNFYVLKSTGSGETTFVSWGFISDTPIASYDTH